jgi:transglutaminase 1
VLSCFVGEEMRLPVSAKDYMGKLVEYGIMKLCASATVKETNQTWIEEDDFQVIMPSVDIKVNIHFK